MKKINWLRVLGLLVGMALVSAAWAQPRPYIGFAYPAGGQQGTTFEIRLGGQNLNDANGVLLSGPGVSAKVSECLRRLNNQEVQLLREQIRDLKRKPAEEPAMVAMMSDSTEMTMMSASDSASAKPAGAPGANPDAGDLLRKVEKRVAEFVQTPACGSIASLVIVEVTIAPDAEPGDREIRLVTPRGVSNPLVFQVGELPEVARIPMLTANLQVLGKEASALRKRPPEEVEQTITLPCTVNGQIASGEVNKYRFTASKGQRLVFSTQARHLVPFIADAVPGWFQPVLVLYNDNGKEVAFSDDYRFKPDPVIFYEVPRDGEYTFVIYDSIYRGREDFVYRVSVGELPFVTSIFPLGGRQGETGPIKVTGWNLDGAEISGLGADAAQGVHRVAATGRNLVSNRLPFELGTLPEVIEKEPNNTMARAQKVRLPIVINGRIDRKDDWDVYQISGKAGQMLTAEVTARRLDSPLDSVLKLTDTNGVLLAFSDDYEDPGAGINTHSADSAFTVQLPADGVYYVHIGDTARQGDEHYGYRLRLSAAQPDFELRVTPSSFAQRSKSSTTLTVHLTRKEGFTGPVKVQLKDPPEGFAANTVTMSGTQTVARLSIRTTLVSTPEPVSLTAAGTATIQGKELTRQAIPVEDRMQAFLWRHLVPAEDLTALVFDPSYEPPPTRVAKAVPVLAQANASTEEVKKPTFTKQQIAGRLRQLKTLFEEGLLTDEFYSLRVAECKADD
jgi:hypothetical protein